MKIPRLLLTAVLIVGAYIILQIIRPIIPSSVVSMYMLFIIIGILLYMTFDDESTKELTAPIKVLCGDPQQKVLRRVIFIFLPLIGIYTAYSLVKPSHSLPVELRTIHPDLPSTVEIYGKKLNLLTLRNPLRGDAANYDKYVKKGGEIYFKNCFYCHGNRLSGRGRYAAGYRLLPVDFTNPNELEQLSESYVFWRIATGGLSLPRESTPWSSAMPKWEHFLSEDEIWMVILFLYDYTDITPPQKGES
jgi:hypothetical protein